MDKATLVKALLDADNKRARSQQTAIGVSQLGGCRRAVWYQINNQPETNTGLRLASIMGTAIHSAIEVALADSGAMLETRVELPGYPPATIDFYDPQAKMIVDWKTTAKKNLRYLPKLQQRWQVQVYAHLMVLAGYEVETVKLMFIPRDGSELDIVEHVEPYDPAVAVEALAWLRDVESLPFEPAPEMSGKFCSDYCVYFGAACKGK